MGEQQCKALRPAIVNSVRILGGSSRESLAERAPNGCKATHQHPAGRVDLGYEPPSAEDEEVDDNAPKRDWARLSAMVYEIESCVCPKCGAEMKVIAIIEDPDELRRILHHLIKIDRSPPGFDPDRLKPRGIPQRSEERSRH